MRRCGLALFGRTELALILIIGRASRKLDRVGKWSVALIVGSCRRGIIVEARDVIIIIIR
jgi:hypothetical protein